MSYDTELSQPAAPVPPPAPLAAPPPSTFALVPEVGPAIRRASLKVAAFGVAVAAIAGALYVGMGMVTGDDAEPAAMKAAPAAPAPAPAKKKTPALTRDPARLGSVLKNLATAEEVYATDHDGRYTVRMAALRAEGFADDPAVRATVVSASSLLEAGGGYCLKASGAGGLVLYYDSVTGRAGRTPCS